MDSGEPGEVGGPGVSQSPFAGMPLPAPKVSHRWPSSAKISLVIVGVVAVAVAAVVAVTLSLKVSRSESKNRSLRAEYQSLNSRLGSTMSDLDVMTSKRDQLEQELTSAESELAKLKDPFQVDLASIRPESASLTGSVGTSDCRGWDNDSRVCEDFKTRWYSISLIAKSTPELEIGRTTVALKTTDGVTWTGSGFGESIAECNGYDQPAAHATVTLRATRYSVDPSTQTAVASAFNLKIDFVTDAYRSCWASYLTIHAKLVA